MNRNLIVDKGPQEANNIIDNSPSVLYTIRSLREELLVDQGRKTKNFPVLGNLVMEQNLLSTGHLSVLLYPAAAGQWGSYGPDYIRPPGCFMRYLELGYIAGQYVFNGVVTFHVRSDLSTISRNWPVREHVRACLGDDYADDMRKLVDIITRAIK